MSSFSLTPQVEHTILSFIRAGGFPHVAAEAAGIPRRVFEGWLDEGERPDAQGPMQEFARAVRQAEAQARLSAEVSLFTERPLDWLKCGPGRPTPDRPGWTAPARASENAEAERRLLLDPQVQQLLALLQEALVDRPDVWSALEAKVKELERK